MKSENVFARGLWSFALWKVKNNQFIDVLQTEKDFIKNS